MNRFFERTAKGRLAMSRRAMLTGLLGGVGAVVALPTLEAMLNSHGTALADGKPLPRRLMTWFFGNGARLDRWVPQGQGPNYPLSDELMPFESLRKYVSVLSGFENKGGYPKISHHEGMVVLSGHPFVQEGGGFFSKSGGPTVDQVAASHIGSNTVFPSIELGVSKRVAMNEGPMMQFISHKSTELPQPPEYNPQALFNKLFSSYTPEADYTGPMRVSVLDVVREDALDLQKRVGTADRMRLEAHLDSISLLQKQIGALPPVCMMPELPSETNVDVGGLEPLGAVNKAMSDLLVFAFKCDLTRCASYMFTSGVGSTIFNTLTNMEHHGLTHSFDQELVHKDVVFTMQCLAYLAEQFMAVPEGAGNMLDNLVLFCSSDCAEGATHAVYDQPILVVGGGGGTLKTPGVHYRSSGGENTTDILLACVQSVAPEVKDLGSGGGYSNNPCKAILA